MVYTLSGVRLAKVYTVCGEGLVILCVARCGIALVILCEVRGEDSDGLYCVW